MFKENYKKFYDQIRVDDKMENILINRVSDLSKNSKSKQINYRYVLSMCGVFLVLLFTVYQVISNTNNSNKTINSSDYYTKEPNVINQPSYLPFEEQDYKIDLKGNSYSISYFNNQENLTYIKKNIGSDLVLDELVLVNHNNVDYYFKSYDYSDCVCWQDSEFAHELSLSYAISIDEWFKVIESFN